VCKHGASLANLLGVSVGNLPMKYLGLPLISIYLKPKHYVSLLDATRSKVDGWALNLLSFPRRIELIKSVLHNLPSYWVFSLGLPNSIIKRAGKYLCKVPMGW